MKDGKKDGEGKERRKEGRKRASKEGKKKSMKHAKKQGNKKRRTSASDAEGEVATRVAVCAHVVSWSSIWYAFLKDKEEQCYY